MMLDRVLALRFKNLKNTHMALIFLAFFIGLAWLIEGRSSKDVEIPTTDQLEGIDTYIPNGFVLVPIEVQNLASLDSMIGRFGIIDLYQSGKNHPIAKNIRIIRSPKDLRQFAVLVSDDMSSEIVKHSDQPYQVVLQNPENKVRGKIVGEKRSQIHWED